MWRGPTYRVVDGERIDGAWCHVWLWRGSRDDGAYSVDDLVVFADGTVLCGWATEPTDADGLRGMLASGRLVLTDPSRTDAAGLAVGDGTPGPRPSKWRSRYAEPLTPEGFLREVRDTAAELDGRTTSGELCRAAVDRYCREPTQARRAELRAAYAAVPPHLRVFVLGDMDLQDRPLRILLTDVGEAVDGDGPVVTEQMHRDTLDRLARGEEGARRAAEARAVRYADDPAEGVRPVLTSYETVFPQGWPEAPGEHVLRADFPARIVLAGESYPSVLHGYWALSAADPDDRRRIRAAGTGREAQELGGRVARREGWSGMRVAVMSALLRAKFTQHPALADVLAGTGDARISYTGLSESPFWRDGSEGAGRNWTGRLLELVRAELLARRAPELGLDLGLHADLDLHAGPGLEPEPGDLEPGGLEPGDLEPGDPERP